MSLRVKLTLLLSVLVALVAALSAWMAHVLNNAWLAWVVIVAAMLLPVVWLAARVMRPIAQLLRALAGTVASYREGDFSLSLVADRDDELGELMIGAQRSVRRPAHATGASGAARAVAGYRDAKLTGGLGAGRRARTYRLCQYRRASYAERGTKPQRPALRRCAGARTRSFARRRLGTRRQFVLGRDRGGRGDIPPVTTRLHPAGANVSGSIFSSG